MCSLRTRNGLRRCRPATPPVGSLTPGMPRRYRRCPRFGFVQNVPYTAGEPVAAPEGKSKRKSSGAPSVGNASRSSDGRSEETSDKRYASVEHKVRCIIYFQQCWFIVILQFLSSYYLLQRGECQPVQMCKVGSHDP